MKNCAHRWGWFENKAGWEKDFNSRIWLRKTIWHWIRPFGLQWKDSPREGVPDKRMRAPPPTCMRVIKQNFRHARTQITISKKMYISVMTVTNLNDKYKVFYFWKCCRSFDQILMRSFCLSIWIDKHEWKKMRASVIKNIGMYEYV